MQPDVYIIFPQHLVIFIKFNKFSIRNVFESYFYWSFQKYKNIFSKKRIYLAKNTFSVSNVHEIAYQKGYTSSELITLQEKFK